MRKTRIRKHFADLLGYVNVFLQQWT